MANTRLDWIQNYMVDAPLFYFLISAVLLSKDSKALESWNQPPRTAGQHLARRWHRYRSDQFDRLAGINYHEQAHRTVCMGLSQNDPPVTIDQVLNWAFTNGYPDWAAQAKSWLDRLDPLPFYPNGKKGG